nr:MAG TPA: hypothetical protein [Caudoviricetes sp.]
MHFCHLIYHQLSRYSLCLFFIQQKTYLSVLSDRPQYLKSLGRLSHVTK